MVGAYEEDIAFDAVTAQLAVTLYVLFWVKKDAVPATDAVIAFVAHDDVPVKLAPTIVSVDGLYVNAFRPSINVV